MSKKEKRNYLDLSFLMTIFSIIIACICGHSAYLYGSKIVTVYLGYTAPQKNNSSGESLPSDKLLQKLLNKKGYCVLFSPDDPISEVLLHLIDHEKKGIKIAIFTFTDSVICKALITAINRGIRVDILTDRSGLLDRYGKVDELYKNGAHIYVFNAQWDNKKRYGIMHNKFIIFEQNIQDRSFVWTGSYNFTRSARQVNQENVVIVNRSGVSKKFQNQFNVLLHRSDVYHPLLTPYSDFNQ